MTDWELADLYFRRYARCNDHRYKLYRRLWKYYESRAKAQCELLSIKVRV